MISSILETAIVLIGLAATAVLFYRFPRLPAKTVQTNTPPTISVIIPARNEEKNLGLLLGDIALAEIRPFEVICADDASEDRTAELAREYGVRLISIFDKPEGWNGKSWACQQGAEAAKGEILLFLDADVRLSKDGLSRLIRAYMANGATISVQPFHRSEKCYEQLSLIFNLVQIAANGTALGWGKPIGLYGPVVMISRSEYFAGGGHEAVRDSIVEDMAMGMHLSDLGFCFRDFVGDGDISFRMYGGGVKSLLEGWTKNLASGAARTSIPVFVLVFFWISSLISVPYHMIAALFASDWKLFALYGVLYIIWVLLIRLLSTKIGRFRVGSALLYPIPLAVFLGIFALSAVKKTFRMKVRWKGREISMEGEKCD